MQHFSDAERTLLADLVPTLIRLDAIDHPAVHRWVTKLTDHERALLLTWVIRYGFTWPAPAAQPEN